MEPHISLLKRVLIRAVAFCVFVHGVLRILWLSLGRIVPSVRNVHSPRPARCGCHGTDLHYIGIRRQKQNWQRFTE